MVEDFEMVFNRLRVEDLRRVFNLFKGLFIKPLITLSEKFVLLIKNQTKSCTNQKHN